jgi:hypothetical protein
MKLSLLLRFRYSVGALKSFSDIAAALALEALQIQGTVALLINLDRDGFL